MAKWKIDDAYPVPLDQGLAAWITASTMTRWILKPWIAADAITLLVAPAKTGKTTFVMDLLAAMHHGIEFLGVMMSPLRVIYVTEQSPLVFKTQADLANITGHDFPIDLMARYRFLDKTWDQFCEIVLERVLEMGTKLLIIDTWAGIAGFAAEMENDSPEARARLEGLGPILAAGCAVIIVAHQGHVGRQYDAPRSPISAARGSTGLGDGVDCAIWLQRRTGQAKGSGGKGDPLGPGRTLWAEGRFVETPTMKISITRHVGISLNMLNHAKKIHIPSAPGRTYVPIRGSVTQGIIAKWSYDNGLPPDIPAANMSGCPHPDQTFTNQELRAIWGISDRQVRRRVAQQMKGGQKIQRLVEPGQPLRYYFPDTLPDQGVS